MSWKKYYEAHTKRCIHHAKWVMGQNIDYKGFRRRIKNAGLLAKCFRQDVIPFMDLSVGTICTLRCRDCSQWNPYLKNRTWFA